MDGTKTEYAGLIFVNSQLYGLRRRRASEYHNLPDVVVKHPTRYKEKSKLRKLPIHPFSLRQPTAWKRNPLSVWKELNEAKAYISYSLIRD